MVKYQDPFTPMTHLWGVPKAAKPRGRGWRLSAWAALAVFAACFFADARSPAKETPPSPPSNPPSAAPVAPGAKGCLEINITDVLGNDIPARVELQNPTTLPKPLRIEAPMGRLTADVPAGNYRAYVYIWWQKIPVMVDTKDLSVQEGKTAYLLTNLLEGAAGSLALLDFDQDRDFVIDRVEKACGTDPYNAASIPGRPTLVFDDRVFDKKEAWYCGELHARSTFGGGKESPAQLVRRAESAGLDFLAITDRNTMDACSDPGFRSDSVVLIPALEWGSDQRGVALLYGPRTFPEFVDDIPQAQALVDLIQAQGGFFAIAHPCFPTAPWQWGLSFVNGMEVWNRGWRSVPPLSLHQLGEDLKERKDGLFVHSMALAAATNGLSANGQASIFYDAELVRGLKAAVIGGSGTGSPGVPMGSPATFVQAPEKSVKGILDGMRRGRTYVAASPKGPRLRFVADILKDGSFDTSIGGIVPLNIPISFEATVDGAKTGEIQILLNGRPLISKKIEGNPFTVRFDHTPQNYSVYRVRVIAAPGKKDAGFGPFEMLAMSSPIYAQDVKIKDPKIEKYLKEHPADRSTDQAEPPLPASPAGGEIVPKWKF